MKSVFTVFCVALALSSASARADFIGRGVKGTVTWHACKGTNCLEETTTPFDVYVGRQGHMFDFEGSAAGEMFPIGKPFGGRLVTLHGNTLVSKKFGGTTIVYTIQGNACSVAIYGTVQFTITSQTCTVTTGRGGE